jgi:hypothetical protein
MGNKWRSHKNVITYLYSVQQRTHFRKVCARERYTFPLLVCQKLHAKCVKEGLHELRSVRLLASSVLCCTFCQTWDNLSVLSCRLLIDKCFFYFTRIIVLKSDKRLLNFPQSIFCGGGILFCFFIFKSISLEHGFLFEEPQFVETLEDDYIYQYL